MRVWTAALPAALWLASRTPAWGLGADSPDVPPIGPVAVVAVVAAGPAGPAVSNRAWNTGLPSAPAPDLGVSVSSSTRDSRDALSRAADRTGEDARRVFDNDRPRPQAPEREPVRAEAKPRTDKESRVASVAAQWENQTHTNPNTGNANWNGWCLGFVSAVTRAATGRTDPGLAQPHARASYNAMIDQGRISRDFSGMPAGSAVYWEQGRYGHVAVFSGRYTSSSEPIIITTGFGSTSATEVPMSRINAALGPASGYAELDQGG